jgi:cation:H+ antiporter
LDVGHFQNGLKNEKRMVYIEIIIGFILLVAGGDLLVRGAVKIARHLGVSSLLIGITLVGFGTSMPELVTSVEAALLESPGIAVGNVVGSNIANVLLILGVAALLRPISTPRSSFRRDGGMALMAMLACAAVIFVGFLSRPAGAVLILMLFGYMIYAYQCERRTFGAEEPDVSQEKSFSLVLAIFLAFGGLAIVIFGARLLIFGAIDLAEYAGVSETIIGLTIVAIGTSLPELITSVMAAIRKESDVAFGNIVGSNIYNVFGILGVTALVHPIPIPPEIIRLDVWVMIAATFLMLIFAATNWRLGRREGATLLAAYTGYIGYLAYSA